MQPFDLAGPLPTGTTVLEASAGTGKTYALAGLVTRYVAEGQARLDEMLLITFGRAASQELRERVRAQLVEAERALADPAAHAGGDGLLGHLASGAPDEVARRRARLRDGLAGFDAATIATTHQFCQLVLRSLGIAGDTDAGVTLVEDLDDLVEEVVDDLYLQRFGDSREDPHLTRKAALEMAREVVGNPHTRLVPASPRPGSREEVRVSFARAVLTEMEHRKRRLGILGFDDLLTRLAHALRDPDAPARARMRQRWRIVMVDEFQDTDPVQWEVIDAAFRGHATLVLIGDPKQAIYAFRGGDIVTYLRAAETAGVKRTLATNWRSDRPLVEALQVVLRGAALGHDEIVVRDVDAHHQGSRLAGSPSDAPFRLRVVHREQFGTPVRKTIQMDALRAHVTADLAADIGRLLSASGATYDGRPVRAGDVAVIVEAHKDARACREALAAAGIPAVYTGDTDIFSSPAAADWLCLLEAFAQPHRSGLVRAAATTRFFGETARSLHVGGDRLTDHVGGTLREWADHLRARGVAAVFEAARVAGMAERVLAHRGGERHMTDLAHLAQLLHETAHRERLGPPALLDWLRDQCEGARGSRERTRRLDSDAAAVQIMTVWVSKGLQYPIVYLPFAFNRHVPDREHLLFHGDGVRSLDIAGKGTASHKANQPAARAEVAGDDIRLTYVALTRAQSQVVAWWAPSWEECHGGLSRLLRGRGPGEAALPATVSRCPSDDEALARFREWEELGGLTLERSVLARPESPSPAGLPPGLDVRRFTRRVDTSWRRTSYSGLVRAAAESQAVGVTSEPEEVGTDDEATGDEAMAPVPGSAAAEVAVPSPMADLPAGAAFGSLVHAVLEHADPRAADLRGELLGHVVEQARFWGHDGAPEELAEALVPLHDTPLGPLLPGLTLRDIPLADRLRELDFEIPLAGGDGPGAAGSRVADLAPLLREHLAADDPMREYADRLADPTLGEQPLRGYLSGSVDVVLRVPGDDGSRFVVVDWKTNRLGDPEQPLTSAAYSSDRLAAAMLHSDYPLQALLYAVVLHRFLRWRLPDYDPARHLGGLAYLYLRGMCGPDTPVVDGHPAGVFSWPVPPTLVTALSDRIAGEGR
jgi:exodeoxyribonuclease V beta subunit